MGVGVIRSGMHELVYKWVMWQCVAIMWVESLTPLPLPPLPTHTSAKPTMTLFNDLAQRMQAKFEVTS